MRKIDDRVTPARHVHQNIVALVGGYCDTFAVQAPRDRIRQRDSLGFRQRGQGARGGFGVVRIKQRGTPDAFVFQQFVKAFGALASLDGQ